MGKVKKAKKEKGDAKAEAKAAKKAKAEKKAGKKGNKQAKKSKDSDDMDEDDLIRTLEEYRQAWADEHKVTEETIEGPPSRRANAVLTPSPVSEHLYLFGGEYYDGQTVELYADLYRYDPSKNEWRKFTSPSQPGPRSAHQMVATPAGGGKIWIFGGEFSAPNQSSFHHYRDLWSFDIATSTWERWDTKLRPSARSGHRMCVWKNYIFLFGGFQDTGVRTSYLNDLWVWSLTDYRWHQIEMREVDRKPPARSGFSFIPTPDGIVLYGGYTKKYEGKKVEGIALNDNWLLKIPPLAEDGSMDFTKFKWEKRKNPGYAPNPTRSGCTMAFWAARNMGVLFGGVSDTDPDEETLESVFYNELFGYNTAGHGRWISLPLKKKKKAGGGNKKKKAKQAAAAAAAAAEAEARRRQEAGEDTEDEDERREREREERGSDDDDMDDDDDDGPKPWELAKIKKEEEVAQAEEDDPDDPEKSLPGPRYNAMLAVQRNTLYIYGGILENGDREYTLDDFFTLDLTKLDRYNCLRECVIETAEWHGSDSENDDDDDDDDDGSEGRSDEEEAGDEEDDEGRPEGDAAAEVEQEMEKLDLTDAEIAAIEAEKARVEREELDKKARAFMGVASATDRSAEDLLSTPQPGETLAVFYARSKTYWAQKAHETIGAGERGKELRKSGFEIAQQRYEEYRPMLERIQAIQEQAGLDAAEAKATARAGLVATDDEFRQILRSELLGSPFRLRPSKTPSPAATRTPRSQRRPHSSLAHESPVRRPVAPAPPPKIFPTPPPSRDPVFDFGKDSSSSQGPRSPLDGPLDGHYRLSPFNPTTFSLLSSGARPPRSICPDPCKVLDAPGLSDDYYENVIDWSTSNHLLAVGLGSEVYTWKSDATVKRVVDKANLLVKASVSSTKWIEKTQAIAFGDRLGLVSLYDAETSQLVRRLTPHAGRVGVLASSGSTLTSGSQDRFIYHRDIRTKQDVVSRDNRHSGEITALKWNGDGELATGANDNGICIFKGLEPKPILELRKAHSAAISLDWSPHQSGLLVSGGGTTDRLLRFWNTHTGTLLREIDTGSQVCQVLWSRSTNEVVSSHGFSVADEPENCVHVWKYTPSSHEQQYSFPIATLGASRRRMLYLTLSPDGRYVVCGSGDEVLRFWAAFPPSPLASASRKRKSEILEVSGKIR
ncbi:hypothetical protein JCM10212_005601 [Sporobolomyces blumeae]